MNWPSGRTSNRPVGEDKHRREAGSGDRFHDLGISLLLAAIWIVAALIVYRSDTGVTLPMLFIGTVFFFLLLPAMKELVKIIDRRVKNQLGLSDPDEDDNEVEKFN